MEIQINVGNIVSHDIRTLRTHQKSLFLNHDNVLT